MMKVNWPDGKRIAIMLAFDIDAELMWMLRNDENEKHPANISRGHYSVRQGVPRILKLLAVMPHHHILHWIEGNKLFRKYRKPE